VFKSIKITNYRGIKELELKNFSRVNLITGKNGTGKTSILESLFLNFGASNAGLAGKIHEFRGDFGMTAFGTRVFSSIFPNMNLDVFPTIEIIGNIANPKNRSKRSLQIIPIRESIGNSPSTEIEKSISGVRFGFKGPSGKSKGTLSWERIFAIDGSTQGAALRGSGESSPDLVNANFMTPYLGPTTSWGQTYSQLSETVKKRQVPKIVENLKSMFPNLKDLIPLSEESVGVIYADVGTGTLIPVTLMGAGFGHVLRLVLTAEYLQDGAILIDEIEGGLHFTAIDKVIEFIFSISKKNNIQFFISTHSDEVLSRFLALSNKNKFAQLASFRISQRKDKIIATRFSNKELAEAAEIQAEIR